MKKIYNIFTNMFLFSICLYCIACSQQSNNINTSDEVGKYTFTLLKNFDNITKQDFIDHFLTLKQIQSFVNSEKNNIDEYFIERFSDSNFNQNEWTDQFLNIHFKIKTEAKKFGIKWSEIQYQDFSSDIVESDGFTVSNGILYFTHNNINYSIETTALKDNFGYKLTDLCFLKIVE